LRVESKEARAGAEIQIVVSTARSTGLVVL
jgi:hypothetical protein